MPAVEACCLDARRKPDYVTSIIARQDKGNDMQPDGAARTVYTPPPAGCTAGSAGLSRGQHGLAATQAVGTQLRPSLPWMCPSNLKDDHPELSLTSGTHAFYRGVSPRSHVAIIRGQPSCSNPPSMVGAQLSAAANTASRIYFPQNFGGGARPPRGGGRAAGGAGSGLRGSVVRSKAHQR